MPKRATADHARGLTEYLGMLKSRILIVDDDPDVACAARLLLRRLATHVDTLEHPAQLDAYLADVVPDVVLVDMNFAPGRTDGSEGLAMLDKLVRLPLPPVVIALTAYADVPLAVQALKLGAADFVAKPWDNAKLVATVSASLARCAARRGSVQGPHATLLGDSRGMQDLRTMLQSIAPTEANVLILGENGVGKELVARAIHDASHRSKAVFLAVDVGTLPLSTLESELFGHVRGAFTDARSDRVGRFQAARNGTLFLDEIGNLPLQTQSKLLRVLERREVTPVGSDRSEDVDVRIVSATNVEEAQLLDPQVFRTDLLFRLNTIVLRVPPLRERRADVPLLLQHYLSHYAARYSRDLLPVGGAAMAVLQTCRWPGNIRALRHACERAVIVAQGSSYGVSDFGVEASAEPRAAAAPAMVAAVADGALNLETLEKEAIAAALAQSEGNISHAAKRLGLSRTALYRRLEKHGLRSDAP